MGLLLRHFVVRDSMGRMWPLLQSCTTQSLLQFPILAPLGGVYLQFSLVVTSCCHYWSKLSRVGPPRLGKSGPDSLPSGMVLDELTGGEKALCLLLAA